MKSFLVLTVLGVAGLGLLSNQAARVSHEIAKDVPAGSLELGLKALTGQLTAERLAELEAALTHQDAREPQGVSEPALSVSEPAGAIPEPVRSYVAKPVIVEAWTDDRGMVHVKLADGSLWLCLASGELVAVQLSNNDRLATLSPVQ